MTRKWDKHRDNQSLIEDYLNNGGKINRLGSSAGVDEELDKKLSRFYGSAEWKEARRIVFEKNLHLCNYCGSNSHLQVDHIKPLRYFWDLRVDLTNLQILCSGCNREKGSKTSKIGFLGKHNQGSCHDGYLSQRNWKINSRISALEKQISIHNSDEVNDTLRRQIVQLQALL